MSEGGWLFRMTTNGGGDWKNVYSDTIDYNKGELFYQIRWLTYPDPYLCIVCRDSGIVMKSTNQGETWENEYYDKSTMQIIEMYDKYNGIRLEYNYYHLGFNFFYTEDASTTWLPVEVPPDIKWMLIRYIFPLSSQTVAFAGYSEDYGEVIVKWNYRENVFDFTTINFNYRDINILDTMNIWYIEQVKKEPDNTCRNIVYHSNDFGQSNNKILDTNDGPSCIMHIRFRNNEEGIIFGPWKIIRRTTDGGQTWIEDLFDSYKYKDLPRDPLIADVVIGGNDSYYLVDNNSEVFKFVNGTGILEGYAFLNEQISIFQKEDQIILSSMYFFDSAKDLKIYNINGSLIYQASNVFSEQVIFDKDLFKDSGIYFIVFTIDHSKLIYTKLQVIK
jgi:hypothetical protein